MSERVDLLLVNPGGRKDVYQALAGEYAAIEPPVWVFLIAAYARGKGLTVEAIDANAEELTYAETAERVARANPRLCAVIVYGHNPSASTQVMPAAGEITRLIKGAAPEVPTIMIGGHVAALPERTFAEEACDFVCTGEGPVTVVELLGALSGKRALEEARGLIFEKDGATVKTPPAPLVTDLDGEMGDFAWDLLPMERYRAHNWHAFGEPSRTPYAAVYTTLGCPFRCNFCCIQAPFKSGEAVMGLSSKAKSYRMWSPETILRQIDILVREYGVKNIKFADELFVLDKDHVMGICDELVKRDYGLNIWAYARVDTLKGMDLEKIRAAGVKWFALGVESASERVRGDAVKGFKKNKIFDAVGEIRKAGIYIGANYIFGLPEDDLQTMGETLELALELNTEWANFNCAMAYPGSALYETAIEEGWELPSTWAGYSQYAYDMKPLPTKYLTPAQVLAFRDEAFHRYFENPAYLELVSQRFGAEAREHVLQMTKTRLKRKLLGN
ncbi:radical SAM protein [bacterium]|nr:MAG: radical SAM protein [bacterium]